MDELSEITEYIQGEAGEDAEMIFGHGVDPNLGDRIRVTVIATGFRVNHKWWLRFLRRRFLIWTVPRAGYLLPIIR
jgi:cell division GTPase FtsZ